MTGVFLDSVGLVAIWNKSDQWHNVASESYESLKLRDISLYTTTYVLLECGNAVSRKPFRTSVIKLRNELEAIQGLIEPTTSDWQTGWHEYEYGFPGSAGIVDCISFAVMRRL
jgi:predicted nucleic acid-binding protein